jgi:hypothetical protein
MNRAPVIDSITARTRSPLRRAARRVSPYTTFGAVRLVLGVDDTDKAQAAL